MTAEDQTTGRIAAATPAAPPGTARQRARALARAAMWRLAPAYGRRRARKAAMGASLQRLQDDFEHVRKRHTEQIERLEDLAREFVLTAESLRREIAEREPRDGD